MTYLWRVHGVDYYAGKEAAEPLQFKLRSEGKRMLRGPRPEEGEQATEAEGRQLNKATLPSITFASSTAFCRSSAHAFSCRCSFSHRATIYLG